ncbi:MAG TPA: GNAT family N-acetyltransferase [Ktedonobacteraceae bacterium]|nr:GNAT family N-acetyltransferase [Ktedonobacteraceae bacterium]
MSFLALPSETYKESYLQALLEFQAEGRNLTIDVRRLDEGFGGFVQFLREQTDRSKIAPGRVPSSDFWLIDDNEYIGRLSVRHELNDQLLKVGGHIGYEIRPSKRRLGYGNQILQLGLQKAKELGLRRVLVTCDEDNIGSKKIIENNGGQFENAIEIDESNVKKLRYWIDIP